MVFVILPGGKADAAGSFDGIYNGTQRTTLTDYTNCTGIDKDGYIVVVADNHFIGRWGIGTFNVDVAPDGSFDTHFLVENAKTAEIKGKITGDKFEADVVGRHCAAHLSLDKGT